MGVITKEDIRGFYEEEKNTVNTFRTLLLFGKNTSTYKFAFCHSLLRQKAKAHLSYEDLRDEFIKELFRHYKSNKSQFNAGENNLTKTMDQDVPWEELVKAAEKVIYKNVFDAFQNVGGGSLASDHLLFEHDKKNKKLTLTDYTLELLENRELIQTIDLENQARWQIVEEAWKAGLSPNLLEYNPETEKLESICQQERTYLRSAVDTLVPYQKGRCFYCNRGLKHSVDKQNDAFPDVDHVLPFAFLRRAQYSTLNANGVWNLVVACKSCNRGEGGKFDSPPDDSFYQKLKRRNLLFVEEHKHSLRNSILLSLGAKNKQAVGEMMDAIKREFDHLAGWKPKYIFHNED